MDSYTRLSPNIKLLHEWSKTWRDLALRTDKGIIPPSVRYPDEAINGDETDLARGYDKMLQHLRYNFPKVTSEALFTDRVYLTADNEYDPADYARALLTGDEISISASPYPSITWTNCPDDLTILVSESTPKSLKIKLFLYGKDSKKQRCACGNWRKDGIKQPLAIILR